MSGKSFKLYYFDIKGKGEPIRLFCAYAGLALEDIRFATYADFLALKESGKLAYGQVPMLEIDGKEQLVQSSSIMTYLSKIAGTYPDDPLMAAKVEASLCAEADAFISSTVVTYPNRFGFSFDEDASAKAYKAISDEILPRHLTNLEKQLKESSTGWIAGTSEPSVADFVWFCQLYHSVPAQSEFPEKLRLLEDYPTLKGFVEKMLTLDAVAKFYSK